MPPYLHDDLHIGSGLGLHYTLRHRPNSYLVQTQRSALDVGASIQSLPSWVAQHTFLALWF